MANSGYSRANIAERFSEFILNDVELSSHILGAGSFGEVVLANWGGTICAAKRLHRVFSILPQDAYGSVIKRYLQECHTWSQLRHPGIVLFIGVVFEPGDSYLPLLVMEKMDSSLLHFVESRRKASLPLRHKAKILLQVACAMAYLHGKKLIHRDLTPNNILMDELSIKAKITDFGLTRVTAESRMATKSAAGTPTFMPPEALRLEPRHDSKLDVFSFGNLILFTTTHKWPMPDVQAAMMNGVLKAFTEYERRVSYISILDNFEKQLFLDLIQETLDNDPDSRPTSSDVMKRMGEILSQIPKDMENPTSAKSSPNGLTSDPTSAKSSPSGLTSDLTSAKSSPSGLTSDPTSVKSSPSGSLESTEAEAKATELSKKLQDRNTKLFNYTLKIDQLKEEKEILSEKVKSLELQLYKSESNLQGLISAQSKLSPVLLRPQDPPRNDQLSLTKELLMPPSSPLNSPHSPTIMLRPRPQPNLQLIKRSSIPLYLPGIDWKEEGNGMPNPMFMASAAVIGGTVYVGGGYSSAAKTQTDLYKFNPGEKQWVILPPPPHPCSGFTLVAQGDSLHLIGGEYARMPKARSLPVSDKVQTLNVSSSITEWSTNVPPLKCPRYSAAAISHEGYIIVAGGIGLEEEPVHTLEIIYLSNGKKKSEWISINKMPLRCHVRPQLVMYNKVIYLAGRKEDSKDNTKVFSLPFRELLEASKMQGRRRRSSVPQFEFSWLQESAVVAGAAIFVLGGEMMAAGGNGEKGGYCWCYNAELKGWVKNCSIPRAREDPVAAVYSKEEVILLGGSQSVAGERKAVGYVDIGTHLD